MATRLHGLCRDAREPYRIVQSAVAFARQPAPSGWPQSRCTAMAELPGRRGPHRAARSRHRHPAGRAARRLRPAGNHPAPGSSARRDGRLAGRGRRPRLPAGSPAISLETAAVFAAASAGLGLAASLAALLVHVVGVGALPGAVATLRLAGLAVLEQLGPRQLLQLWHLRFWLHPRQIDAARLTRHGGGMRARYNPGFGAPCARPHVHTTGHRPLSGRGAPRPGRHGRRSTSRATRHRSAGRDQAAPRATTPRAPRAVPARGARRPAASAPNIVTIFDVGEHEGQPVHRDGVHRGRDARASSSAQRAALPRRAQLELIEELCGGLAYAHSRARPPRHQAGEPDGRRRRRR